MTHQRLSSLTLPRLFAAALTALSLLGGTAQAADPRIGVSVDVSQPGFYGRFDIGDRPAPAIIYPQPIIIQQTPVAVHRRPIYMRVPPGHSKNWAHYCGRYSACGQPVYFVRYDERRAPAWRDRHDDHEHHRHHRHDRHDRYDRNDRHDHDKHGRGHKHGHGHDKDHGHGRHRD